MLLFKVGKTELFLTMPIPRAEFLWQMPHRGEGQVTNAQGEGDGRTLTLPLPFPQEKPGVRHLKTADLQIMYRVIITITDS